MTMLKRQVAELTLRADDIDRAVNAADVDIRKIKHDMNSLRSAIMATLDGVDALEATVKAAGR